MGDAGLDRAPEAQESRLSRHGNNAFEACGNVDIDIVFCVVIIRVQLVASAHSKPMLVPSVAVSLSRVCPRYLVWQLFRTASQSRNVVS